MPTGERTDPFRGFNFVVEIDDLSASGFALVIGLVFLNGGIHGAFCSLWEVMQCLPISRRFNAFFAGTVILGAFAMAILAGPFGVVGIAAGYLATNLAWIGFALWRFAAPAA